MNLAKQLPYVFTNHNTVIRSFVTKCGRCGGAVPEEWIEAEIIEYGAHIVVFRGSASCLHCGHIYKVEKKIRDDKSVYDPKRGWLSAKASSREKFRKSLASLVKKKILIISVFILLWQILIIMIIHNPVLARIICF